MAKANKDKARQARKARRAKRSEARAQTRPAASSSPASQDSDSTAAGTLRAVDQIILESYRQTKEMFETGHFPPSQLNFEFFSLGTAPILAGTMDHFALDRFVDTLLPARGKNAASCGTLLRALLLQLAGEQLGFAGEADVFFSHRPLVLAGEDLHPDMLCDTAMHELLAHIRDYGCERFFAACAAHLRAGQGIQSQALHAETMVAELRELENRWPFFLFGGTHKARAASQKKNTSFCLVALSDHHRGDPAFFSLAHSADAPACQDMLDRFAGPIWEQFPQHIAQGSAQVPAVYLAGEAAWCTPEAVRAADAARLPLVARLSQTDKVGKRCRAEADPTAFVDVGDPSQGTVRAQWCENISLGGRPVRALLVEETNGLEKVRQRLMRKAEKEQAELQEKLGTVLALSWSSEEEARKALTALMKKKGLCCLNKVRCRKTKAGIRVQAEVAIDAEAVEARLVQDMRFVLVTTDLDRAWTMEELLAQYRGQPVLQSSLRVFTRRSLLVSPGLLDVHLGTSLKDADQGLLDALFCLFGLTALLLRITERHLHNALAEHKQTMPTAGGEATTHPNILTVLERVSWRHDGVVRENGVCRVEAEARTKKLAALMGPDWFKYYTDTFYNEGWER